MLITRATLLDGTRTDIRADRRIVAMAAEIPPLPGELVHDAAGGTVIPGLHDHHLHVRAAAAAAASVRVGPEDVADAGHLGRVLVTRAPDRDGWVRAVGYHEAAAGPLDRSVLDALCPTVPVRIQHRSGVQWFVNSAGLARLGLAGHPDGVLSSADPRWSAALQRAQLDVTAFGELLSSFGVTGITDATPDLDDAGLVGELRQSLWVLAPGKRILHDDALDLDELTGWIAERHAGDIPVALHCVTAAQLVVALEALRCAGRHRFDRIEHAAVVPDGSMALLAAGGATVVTQPNFVAERGDEYLTDVPEAEHHELWRVASLRRAGVAVALSTDAPFGRPDPWAAMRAAVYRRTPSGAVLGAAERISPADALTLFTGEPQRPAVPRTVTVGAAADLCLLSTPPDETLAELDAGMVAATVIAGEVVYRRD
ncbi:amidohydrolase [Mycolicibacterium duvalii]|uniref:Amidohydrolase n=1 Tax=Mycolicibacterium duvalii TaxID=39688 RepID=A0A7I7K580_9MYCO|nr:amidohydrolase family protein [Mycolicibacterium duvalii]MCV7368875.1 amidohydrolase family protein [Mycolicibacterium duvalii]PEG44371.1 amidohydrolase [Mycolicibacterium duvalii]BBX19227.1 amidohydrolase [Mycolicibacterium duvalii]